MREASAATCSSELPVFSERMPRITCRALSTSRALMAMSDAWPRALERGWCSIIDELGRHARLPFAPLASSIAAVP